MKKRDLSILLITALLCVSFLIPSAWAGSKQKHRWEGVAIGIGATILGCALFKQYHDDTYYSHHKPAVVPAPAYRHPPPRYSRHRGDWEMRKEWVPPTHKRVWNPGHYNRRGEWVAGQWLEIVDRPGYWTEVRVWVSRR